MYFIDLLLNFLLFVIGYAAGSYFVTIMDEVKMGWSQRWDIKTEEAGPLVPRWSDNKIHMHQSITCTYPTNDPVSPDAVLIHPGERVFWIAEGKTVECSQQK